MEISRAFRRFIPQLLHVIVLPLFFFAFMLIYKPFNAEHLIGYEWYGVHLTIVSCIILVSLVLTRLLYYFLPLRINYILYVIWCFGEMVFTSFFAALYLWLVLGKPAPYFEVLAPSIQMIILTLVIPYTIMALSIRVYEYHESLKNPQDNSMQRMRFYDDKRNLKIVLTPESILYIGAEENYVNIFYTENGKVRNYVLRSTMKSIDEMCQDNGLLRCHRSFYLNPKHVKVLRKDKDATIVAELDADGVRHIPISKRYYDRISDIL
ncbi:MAG: LytTR family DNA-binding domain-containing protein [Candidatus Cryptobacteroides sp.]